MISIIRKLGEQLLKAFYSDEARNSTQTASFNQNKNINQITKPKSLFNIKEVEVMNLIDKLFKQNPNRKIYFGKTKEINDLISELITQAIESRYITYDEDILYTFMEKVFKTARDNKNSHVYVYIDSFIPNLVSKNISTIVSKFIDEVMYNLPSYEYTFSFFIKCLINDFIKRAFQMFDKEEKTQNIKFIGTYLFNPTQRHPYLKYYQRSLKYYKLFLKDVIHYAPNEIPFKFINTNADTIVIVGVGSLMSNLLNFIKENYAGYTNFDRVNIKRIVIYEPDELSLSNMLIYQATNMYTTIKAFHGFKLLNELINVRHKKNVEIKVNLKEFTSKEYEKYNKNKTVFIFTGGYEHINPNYYNIIYKMKDNIAVKSINGSNNKVLNVDDYGEINMLLYRLEISKFAFRKAIYCDEFYTNIINKVKRGIYGNEFIIKREIKKIDFEGYICGIIWNF